MTQITEDEKWRAFESKDPAYEGRFYVAVRTTGVYCRLSCSARPLRKNVLFFETPEAAEAAGYRACKRCHPRLDKLPTVQLVERVVAFIRSNGHGRLDALAIETGYSPFHLQRVFKQAIGVSPLQYARTHRADQLKQQLAQSPAASVTSSILDAGFNSSGQAYAQLSDAGVTPGKYKAGGVGTGIGYTIVSCGLGRMLVAGTQRGLCAVYFGDDDAVLERALLDEYPNAEIERHVHSELSDWAQAVQRAIDGTREQRAALRQLPLDVQGTAFQAQVWQALRRIPDGETRSYTAVAREIGRPSAMRAVANACGANRLALVIPCHRVVRENGAAGGYRWGEARKQRLLANEARHV
jgi:AraC family transcriptional regulator of adaptative response/methylated-DNA-[protein]-cysteine methyltransferase